VAAEQLARPGVEVIQEFRTVTPSVITPTLNPCVVGVAKQLVEVLQSDGAGGSELNPDALITLPGFFIASAGSGSPVVYGGLDGLALALSINEGPVVTITFADPTATGLTPATVVNAINQQFTQDGITSAIAETVGTDRFQVRTTGVGEFQNIFVDSTTAQAVADAFGIGLQKTYQGLTSYNQYIVTVPEIAFPDPRDNLDELAIQKDTIRVFLYQGSGTGLQEVKRDESFLRRGEVNDQASFTSTIAGPPTYPTDFYDKTVRILVDGVLQVYTFPGSGTAPADADAVATLLSAGFSGVTVTNLAGVLTWTRDDGGYANTIAVDGTAGTAHTILGLTTQSSAGISIRAIDDGNGDAVTPLLQFDGASPQDFTATGAPATAAVLAGTGVVTYGNISAGDTLVISDGNQEQTITFLGTETSIDGGSPDMKTTIEAVVGPAAGGKITVDDAGTDQLRLTHSDLGEESYIKLVGGTVSFADLDDDATPTLYAGVTANGDPFAPQPGDHLYIDGLFYATITKVAPGGAGNEDVLKIDRQVPISNNIGRRFYIISQDIVPGDAAIGVTIPTPDLTVDAEGNVILKHNLLRDTTGAPISGKAPIYLSYTAVRQDVTALASNPGLLRFDTTTELDSALEPINTDNPLALGLYYAMINAAGIQVTGLGVDEISADSPFGTVEAFTRAAEYLEGYEVYALAPLTHDRTVAEVFNTHVNFMSEPESKGERIVIWNPEVPTNRNDTLVASGTDGDGLTTTTFDTKVVNLSALLLNAGVDATGTIPVSDGVLLDIASDAKRYSVESVSGGVVTIRTVFNAGENDDGYYSTTALTLPLISEAFAIRVRGTALVTAAGTADKDAIAETVATTGQAFQNRRFWMTFPDQAAATIEGLEQLVNGFYMNAAIAGMIGQQPPQQSFTNFPMTGFTRVIGSQDTFNDRQLNVMAGGGAYIIVQDAEGAPLISRMALTTDLTSIETRTDSITKVVDFTAKFMRRGLRSFIGRFNITQGFLDTLGSVIQGLLGFLVETGVLIGGNLNNLVQDEDARDTVLIDVSLDPPYPCNYIRLTLVV